MDQQETVLPPSAIERAEIGQFLLGQAVTVLTAAVHDVVVVDTHKRGDTVVALPRKLDALLETLQFGLVHPLYFLDSLFGVVLL
jgi:hypothetical protein